MKRKVLPKKLLFVLLIPATILLTEAAAQAPALVETFYSTGIFPVLGSTLSRATARLPISVAEVIVVSAAAGWLIITIRTVTQVVRTAAMRRSLLLNYTVNLLVLASIIYFCFNLLWGLNYYRLPFARIAGLEVKPASVSELEAMTRELIQHANGLRDAVREDHQGVMILKGGREKVFASARQGFDRAAALYPELGGSYGQPKKVILSELMSYAGITGIYFAFTGEANINITIPDVSLPYTICHEMAHQRGFAREDEANYIAYLACRLHPDPDFQYSGAVLAVRQAMAALYRHDRQKYRLLLEEYSDGLYRDIAYLNWFWRQYDGPVERISTRINDSYLKANKQTDGVHSYGRMVDLLLAEYRSKK